MSFLFQCIQLADNTKVSDLASLSSSQSDGDSARLAVKHMKHIKTFQYAIGAPARCPFPVIAAIYGTVLSLGISSVHVMSTMQLRMLPLVSRCIASPTKLFPGA